MELQPGQINWGMINPQPLPGAVRMWVWHSFGLGDEFVCTYRFKQPLFGGEQTHKGIIDTDGVSLARGGKEYVQAIEEIRALPTAMASTEIPPGVRARKTAFLWSFENMLDLENHRHHADFDPWEYMYRYYAILKSLGCPVKMVTPGEQVDPLEYPHLVVPAHQIVRREMIDQWEAYARAGGNLIITSRTAKKDPHGHLWKAHNQEPVWDLIGAQITEFDHLPAQYPGKVAYEGNEYLWYKWGDWLTPDEGTETLARYTDQFYAGTAAAVSRNLGRGRVTYIGVHTNDGALEKKIVQRMFETSGTKTMDLPPYVFVEWRDGFWVAVNYASEAYTLPMGSRSEVLYGERQLHPGGVTVWYDK
jgi:beta-galactosidase